MDLVCNMTISCAIALSLWGMKRRLIARRTSSIVSRLIKITVETGLVCTISMFLGLMFYLFKPKTALFAAPLAVLSKLNSNCLLAVGVLHLPRNEKLTGFI